MDPTFAALIAVVIAFPVLAIVSFVLVLGSRERLKRLDYRLALLERRLADLPGGVPSVPSAIPEALVRPPEIKTEEVLPPQTAPEAPVAPPKPALPTAPAKPKISLEERFGTQWVVWAGGIALALGGFFLVRYSIEQGWFGPGPRVVLAGIVALALIAAGEWARRREIVPGLAAIPKAHIPSVLTAAGTAIAFADVYAAYALYGFIGPTLAFLLLGVVALGTLAAAMLHGPALAGLGLIGAFITPLIVSTEQPNYLALYIYLAVVTAAAFALARARLWRWLAISAVVASVLWTLPGLGDLDSLPEHVLHVAIGYILSALLIVSGFLFGPASARGDIDGVSSGALSAYLFAAILLALATGHDSLALLLFCVLVVGTLAIAWRTDSAALAVPAAALFVTLIFLHWSLDFDVSELGLPSGPSPDSLWKPEHYLFGTPLTLGVAFALLFLVSGFLAQGPEERRRVSVLWAASAVFAPIAILIALYYRIAGFDRSIPFAGAALVLAGAFALTTEMLTKRESEGGSRAASAIFATGSIAALALALSLALEKGWLTVALALMVPGIAWIAERRPFPALRWLAAAVTVGVFGRIAWDPRIVGDAVGTRPIFNWLLYGYGIPAAAFWFAGHTLRRKADDVPVRIVDAAAILFIVLLIVLEVNHYIDGSAPYGGGSELAQVGLDVSLLLAVVIGLERIRQKSGSIIHLIGARLLALALLFTIVFGLGARVRSLADRRAGRRTDHQSRAARLWHPGAASRRARLCDAEREAALVLDAGRDRGARPRARLSQPRGAHALSRPGADRGRHLGRRAIHLLRGLARLRRRPACRRHLPPLAPLARRLRGGDRAHRAESVPDRLVGPDRHLPGALVPRPRCGADRHRLVLSAALVPAHRRAQHRDGQGVTERATQIMVPSSKPTEQI